MKEKYTRPANILSKETFHAPNQIGQIGNIFVIVEYENGDVCLILDNRDEKVKSIDIFYEESHKPGEKPLKYLKLPSDRPEKVPLPKGFEEWEKLCFRVEVENQVRPINGSIPNTLLKEWSDEAKQEIKADPSQPKTQSSISKSEQTDNSINIIGKDLKPDIETPNVPEQRSIDYQREAETIVQETRERIAELAHTYKDGEAIDFVNIENPTPSQKVLWILNWVAGTIRKWKNELEQCGGTDRNLIDTLTYGEQVIKERLKAIRGDSTPVPNQLELETDINTDTELSEIRTKCNLHVAQFEDRLFDYEERCEIDNLEQYNQFIPQFIKDRLFNGVARFLSVEQLPEHLDQCLQLVGYEVVPIQIGETKADARLHHIQASQQTGVAPGTIVEVISPGLRRKVNGEIIQKPVVIRGE